jgi:hypothetical protein
LEKIDPESVKRANTFFPPMPADETPATVETSAVELTDDEALAAVPASRGSEVAARSSSPEIAKVDAPAATANLFTALGVPLVACALLLLVQWTILCGAGRAKGA